MSAVRRRLFTLASLLSLLLCVATVVLWVRNTDRLWDWTTPEHDRRFIGIEPGQFVFLRMDTPFGYFQATAVSFSRTSSLVPYPQFSKWGFVGHDFRGLNGVRLVYLAVPAWAVVFLTALFPSLWLISAIRHLQVRGQPLCDLCSYNLTGNTSGVCPECATPVSGKTKVKA